MIETLDLLTFFISTVWLIQGFKNIGKNSRFLICLLVFTFYVFPIGLDWLYEMADYSYTTERVGFIWPRHDFLTVFIYDMGMLYIQYIILYGRLYNKNNPEMIPNNADNDNKFAYFLMIIGMIIPTLATLILVKEPGMLYIMQWRELHLFPEEGSYSTIEKFSYLGISCSVFILFSKSGNRIYSLKTLLKILAFAFIYINICIQGKRAILFYAVVNIMVILYIHLLNMKNAGKSIKKYIRLVFVAVIVASYVMISVTSYVKSNRGYEVGSTVMYTTMRIDFLRDDRVRMAIYYALYPNEIDIVAYPGQTFLNDFLSFIPLNYISDKLPGERASYQTRFTHALLHIDPSGKLDIENTSWMTVTFFAEIISNCGVIFGFLFIPWICLWFIRMIDKFPYPYNSFIICCFILLNLFDFVYVAVFIEFTLLICLIYKKKENVQYIQNESISNRTIA